MREILFKAREVDNGEWCQGYYAGPNSGADDTITTVGIINMTFVVNPETVCQYIGVEHPEHGKIFEGDVFRDKDGIFVVSFEDKLGSCGCCFEKFIGVGFAGKYLKSSYVDEFTTKLLDGDIEFVGNIHDDDFDIERTEL